MAKRIQVQGPNVRSQQIQVNAPIVDTYFKPEQEANKYAELSNFLNKVVPEVTRLAVDKQTKQIKKDIDLIGEMSYSQKDWGVFEEFIKEKGITNTHATYTAYNARRGMEDGKLAKVGLDKYYQENSARWMSQPDSTLMKTEVNNWLQENFPQGREAETGYLTEYTKVLQNHNNHLDQNHTQAHRTLIQKDEENGLIENIANLFTEGVDGQEITDTTKFLADTGVISDGAYGRKLIEKGVILSIEEDIAANGGMNIEKIAEKWANLTTATGAKLSAVKGSNEIVQAAINTALAKRDQDEARADRAEQKLKDEQGEEITNLVYTGQAVDPEEYPNLTPFEFNKYRTIGENSLNGRVVGNETSVDAYRRYEEAFANAPTEDAKEAVRDILMSEAQTIEGQNRIKGAFANATLGLKDKTLDDYKAVITRKYQLKLAGIDSGTLEGAQWLPTQPADKIEMKAEIERAEQAWLTYKMEAGDGRFYTDESKTVRKSPTQIAADDAAWLRSAQTQEEFKLDAPVPSRQPAGDLFTPTDDGKMSADINGVTVTVTKDDDTVSASVSNDEQSTEEETKVEEVEEPEEEESGFLDLTKEEQEEAIKESVAELTNSATKSIGSWWNSAVQRDGMKKYVQKQTNLIKSRSERKKLKELLSEMTLEQQVAYFAANEVAASD